MKDDLFRLMSWTELSNFLEREHHDEAEIFAASQRSLHEESLFWKVLRFLLNHSSDNKAFIVLVQIILVSDFNLGSNRICGTISERASINPIKSCRFRKKFSSSLTHSLINLGWRSFLFRSFVFKLRELSWILCKYIPPLCFPLEK